MNLDDILNEKIKKVHGKWALVSKSDPDKVLQYYHGKDRPSKEWEEKVERRIHAFAHMNEAASSYFTNIKVDFGKLPSSTIKYILVAIKGPFGHITDNESARWLDHATVIQFSRHNTHLRVKTHSLKNVIRTLEKFKAKYEIVDDKDMFEADIHKTIDDIRQNVHADELEGLKRYSNAQLADWLKRLTAKNKSAIGPAMATVDSLGPLAKPFARTFVQRQYPTVDNDEFEQMWGVWNRMDDETRSAIKAGDLSTLDPRDEHGFVKETDDEKQSIAQQINFGGAYDDKGGSWTDTVKGWFGSNNNTQTPPASSRPQLQPKRVREADDDYDTWKQRAIDRAKRQAAKKRAELQQVMKGIETDPEKLALQGTIQAARGELSKRKREALAKMEQMKQIYSEFSDEELDKIIGRYSKGPGAGSDFVEWLKSIKQEREDERSGVQQRQDVFRSVAGPMQGKQSQKAAPAQDKPWTQLGITRDEFRKILNNPQHPRHREIKQLQDQYKQVDEDLTRRDFLKGLGKAALGGAALAAMPTQARADLYKQYIGSETTPLQAQPEINAARDWNRVGVNQQGNQFSIVLHKKHGLYLYFVTSNFAKSPYVYIELNGNKYKYRKRTLKNDTFTIEDDRIASVLLNYRGMFKLIVDRDEYEFNVEPSPASQTLYNLWMKSK
jgi:hypothetical protein